MILTLHVYKLYVLNNSDDTLSYVNIYDDTINSFTKLSVTFIITKLYDLLSLLSLNTIKSKIFMQTLWQEKLNSYDKVFDTFSN